LTDSSITSRCHRVRLSADDGGHRLPRAVDCSYRGSHWLCSAPAQSRCFCSFVCRISRKHDLPIPLHHHAMRGRYAANSGSHVPRTVEARMQASVRVVPHQDKVGTHQDKGIVGCVGHVGGPCGHDLSIVLQRHALRVGVSIAEGSSHRCLFPPKDVSVFATVAFVFPAGLDSCAWMQLGAIVHAMKTDVAMANNRCRVLTLLSGVAYLTKSAAHCKAKR